MSVKPIIDEIEKEVLDVTKTGFEYIDTSVVPGSGDTDLTYESGVTKKGKRLKTCVLYVDIRNSVALTEKHYTQTMGRIYTAFTKAVLKIAHHHNGHTRNIIGDRVMIVFPSKNCYVDAVDCAISINHITSKIINQQFDVTFKCGIGVDYGELRVIKVGIQRYGTENSENKGLVWVGYPANRASRLTDLANKEIEEEYFEVIMHPIKPPSIMDAILDQNYSYGPKASHYLSTTEKVKMTTEEFADSIRQLDSGEIYFVDGKIIDFEKKKTSHKYPAILLSEAVYNGYKKAKPQANDIKDKLWNEQKREIPNIKGKVFGKTLIWAI